MSAALTVLAHTGHPAHGLLDGVLHPLTGIDHLLAMVAVGIVAALATDRRTAWRTPAAFLGGMVLGGALGLAGVAVPAVEVLIGVSVVVLGAVVVLASQRDHAMLRRLEGALPVLAVLFGLAHGHAHGAELPETAVPLLYVIGFLVATASLHASGTLAGLRLRDRPALRIALGSVVSAVGAALLVGLVGA